VKYLPLLVAMAAVTYPARLLPLWLLANRRIPPRLLRFFEGFPVAVLAAFVVPLILMPGGTLDVGPHNLELVVAVPTVIVALWSRSLIATVVAGSILMMAARALLG
jgi:branched-subunit amino acid transport protein